MSPGLYARHPSLRGLVTRTLSMVLGSSIAIAMIVGMQVPLLHRPSASRTFVHVLHPSATWLPIAWPSAGEAAVVIPSLGVAQSWHDKVAPIASLTKMMTAYVALQRLPLAAGATGPCVSVTSSDVTTYEVMKSSGESSALVSVGEQVCESDLLNGLLVHSAGNYAVMLADMAAGSTTRFVVLMNQSAVALGLRSTHYADVSGFDDHSVSTALDQGRLAVVLMRSPLVRSIVDQASVTLPVAGTVNSFTPYVGVDDVIGVKSGRTAAAGGCDVMAVTFQQGSTTAIAYAVVLGQRGGDLLGPAGSAALALAQTAIQNTGEVQLRRGRVFGRIGWSSSTASFGLAADEHFSWWRTPRGVAIDVTVHSFTSTIRRGQTVGWVVVHAAKAHRYRLVAEATVSPPSLWQRLR